MLPTRYILYQNGMMSVESPLSDFKPVAMIPLVSTNEGSAETFVVEIQLPKKEIDPEKVILLDPRTQRQLPLEKQTNSLQSGFPRIRFYLSNPLLRQVLPSAYVYYFDMNPQLDWNASYHARLDNHMRNPNAARMCTFSCDLNFRNLSDQKIGPGFFHIMIQQSESQKPTPSTSLYQARRVMYRRAKVERKESLENLKSMAFPTTMMAPMASRTITPSQVGTSVAEGFLIDIPGPGPIEFEKSSSTQIQLIEVHDLPVRKNHYCILENRIPPTFADVKYHFRLPREHLNSPLLPEGNLDLFSESLEYLGSHNMRPIVVGSEIQLMVSKDKSVPIQGDIKNEVFEVDADGNKVIVYTGGIIIKNYYDDEKNPLLFHLYVPVEKPVIKIKTLHGISKWDYEAQQSRIKFYVNPIPAREKGIVNFVIYNSDPIRIQNPQRLKLQISEEMKRKLLDRILT